MSNKEESKLRPKRIAAFVLCSLAVVISTSLRAQDFGNIWNVDGVGKSCDPTTGNQFIIKNDGAYVAEFEIYSGPVHMGTSPHILLGNCYKPPYPGKNHLIKGYVYTGLVWNPRVLFMTAWSKDRDYIITYGTTLDARAVGRNRRPNPNDLDMTVKQ